jgi:hypothetical protein
MEYKITTTKEIIEKVFIKYNIKLYESSIFYLVDFFMYLVYMFVVVPLGGLCNKLRVIFSYNDFAIYNNKKLIVIWKIEKNCPGLFLNYFEPINNITFMENNTNNLKIDYKGCSINNDYPPNYKKLKLLPYMIQIIKNKINLLGNNYIAVHIRRTDHIELAKKNNKYTTDDDFFDFIEKNKKDNNIYIATDNKITYDIFKNKYNNIIKLSYHVEINSLRETSLEDSIIDLFMCIYSSNFKGSGWSSFSDLIYNFRKILN